jgi:hypothetical protein
MQIAIRTAVPADAAALLAIKEQLRLDLEHATDKHLGGFLLGTSLDEYRRFIECDDVLVAECAEPRQVVGFAIALRHATLADSALLQRAAQAQWENAFRLKFDAQRFAFFEQLGMLPDPAYLVYAKYLAFAITWRILRTHEALFTTVLQYPFVNTAALSFIKIVGFEWVGLIDEVYPEVGRIKSDVYYLERAAFEQAISDPRFQSFVARARRLGHLPAV